MSWQVTGDTAKRDDGAIVRRGPSGWFRGYLSSDYDTPIAGVDGRPRKWRTITRGMDAMDALATGSPER